MSDELIMKIERPVLNEVRLREKFKFVKPEKKKFIETVKAKLKKKFQPSKTCFLETLYRKLPVIDLFLSYKLKFLIKDFMAGLTVGIIQIAPTMANATTANLPPINGLYTAFFSVIAYLIFGTSKHLSLGTHGVIAIMVGNCIKSFEGILFSYNPSEIYINGTLNPNFLSENPDEAKIMIAMTLSIFAGAMQLGLGLVNGGVVSKYLCDSLVEALTIGSSYLIVVSQVDSLLGVKITRLRIPFRLLDNIIGIFKAVGQTNVATLIISVISIVAIYSVKRFVNEKFKKKLPAPIPIELIVVIVATILASNLNFNQKYGVSIVGSIPLGIPAPRFPPFGIFAQVFVQSLSIALVGFALNISTAKYYAKKCSYNININQELIAYGSGNILSGMFKGMPATGGLTRTRIVETSGGKTQMFSLISSIFVLIVIVGLGFLFRDLPNCCLAAIIFTALINNCFEVTKLWKLYRKSKIEAIIWFSTFAGVMVFDIDYGLYIGIAVSILIVILRSQLAPATLLGNIPYTDLYEDIDKCADALQIENIRILRYEDSIYYANAESFIHQVFRKLDIETDKILKQLDLAQPIEVDNNKKDSRVAQLMRRFKRRRVTIADVAAPEPNVEDEIDAKKASIKIEEILSKVGFKHLILDCSCVNTIDMMGNNAILQLNETCKKLELKLHLTHLKNSIYDKMNRLNETKFDPKCIYPTNHDAVLTICDEFYSDERKNDAENISSVVARHIIPMESGQPNDFSAENSQINVSSADIDQIRVEESPV